MHESLDIGAMITPMVEVQDIDEAIEPFEDFQYDFIDVPKMIRDADKVYQYPMIDRPPLKTWVYGNVTLLGDAAHPMEPPKQYSMVESWQWN